MFVCLSICFICLSVCVPICLFHLSVCLSVCLPICLFHLSVCLSVLFACLFVHLSVRLSVCWAVFCLFVSLSVYLSVDSLFPCCCCNLYSICITLYFVDFLAILAIIIFSLVTAKKRLVYILFNELEDG